MLRNMTSLYIQWQDEVLLLYRIGSRVIEPSWVGIGGHFEPQEVHDPRACVLRELREETGLTEASLEDLRLRYVSLRHNGSELRQNFYFFARLRGEKPPLSCTEGHLRWVKWDLVPALPMPITARNCVEHYLRQGCQDTRLYGIMRNAGAELPVITPLTLGEES